MVRHRRPVATRAALPWLALALALTLSGLLPASLAARPATQASLTLFKLASVSTARPGQSYSYSLLVIRTGTATVTLQDALDPALVLVVVSPSSGVACHAGRPLRCTLPAGELAAGTITLQVYAQPGTPEGTIIRNQASATSGSETVQSNTTSVRISGEPATPIPTFTPAPLPTGTPLPSGTPTATGTPGPTATSGPPPSPPPGLVCAPQPLVSLPGVRAPDPRLNALAAACFAQVRQEVIARTGQDVLAVLADVLRAPGFTTDKPRMAHRSWHKTGRAIDLNLGGPFTLQRDGAMFRVFVGAVDITAIFEAYGWQRIPAQGSVLEWWHKKTQNAERRM